ncbi:MAG: cytochrome c3 family protein [Pseudomonadota bacterium]
MKVFFSLAGLATLMLGIVFTFEQIAQEQNIEFGAQDPNLRMLPVTFAHADHTHETCVTCHHNYVDDTGSGLCFQCHKTDPQVGELVEQQFHEFCRGCHIDNLIADKNFHGPIRACKGCHTAETEP